MRIQHNIMALNANRNLGINNTNISKNLEKLSSGYRINRAGDDAAGLAISEKMRAQITGLKTAEKNANDGISMVQTAEGALTEVHSMLNRMKELATQSANGIYDDATSRNAMNQEYDELAEEIKRIAKDTDFNGTKLFAADTTISIHIGSESGQTLNIKFEGLENKITAALAADIGSQTGANTAIDLVKTAIDNVSTMRGTLGASQNRLEHTVNNINVNIENLSAAESRVRDVDVASEMMEYTKNNILIQSAQAMLAQANQIPQGVLQLLQ